MVGLLPPFLPEIIRARFLAVQSKLLVEIAHARISELRGEVQRAKDLTTIAREILSVRVQEMLLDMPLSGAWIPGSGLYADIIHELLDRNSPLIEEDHTPDDGALPWRVRLTPNALEMLS